MRLLCLIVLIISSISQDLLGQSSQLDSDIREIGVRFTGFDDFNLIYRKQVRPGVMNRHRFALLSLRVNKDSSTSALDAGYSFGREYYKELGRRISFYQGPEVAILFNYTSNNQNADPIRNLRTTFDLGYILGAQFVINDNFRIGMELIPVFSLYHNNFESDRSIGGFNFNFNSNFTLLTVTYRFVRIKK